MSERHSYLKLYALNKVLRYSAYRSRTNQVKHKKLKTETSEQALTRLLIYAESVGVSFNFCLSSHFLPFLFLFLYARKLFKHGIVFKTIYNLWQIIWYSKMTNSHLCNCIIIRDKLLENYTFFHYYLITKSKFPRKKINALPVFYTKSITSNRNFFIDLNNK